MLSKVVKESKTNYKTMQLGNRSVTLRTVAVAVAILRG